MTAIAQSKVDKDVFAVGYDDGTVRLWDRKLAAVIVVLNLHRSAVTSIAFDKAGVRLASGSKDTDIIIWDLVAEVGHFKLRGHKDQITGLHFVEPDVFKADGDLDGEMALAGPPNSEGFLLTTSKDSLVKLWDLRTRHCIETHIAQTHGECWALGVTADSGAFVTAGNDGEIKFWALDTQRLVSRQISESSNTAPYLRDLGALARHSKERAVEVFFHPRKAYFAVHGVQKSVEIWRMRTDAEVRKSMARKRRRRREKMAASGEATAEDAEQTKDADEKSIDISKAELNDRVVQYVIVRTSGKVRSMAWVTSGGKKDLQLLVGTTNNQLEVYTLPTKDNADKSRKDEPPEYNRLLSVELAGHRNDVRAVALSSDDRMLASAADGSLKIWNVRTRACIRTFECGYALCCAFLPGDKVVIVGCKDGSVELFDVASAQSIYHDAAAHEGAIWSLQVHPDGRSVVTGSADKTAKFWNFQVVQEEVPGTTRTTPKLKLVQTRILKVSDDVLCLKFSPDAKYLAVALLDHTVKVFFTDSLKLYLNLYGHKLPVVDMDISYDSKLIVTGSADKNIKIWGLDFGDCHRTLFKHQDTILRVAFIPHNGDGSGHHFFSSSKDRTLGYFDGDKFEQIQKLTGHHGEVWAMAISHNGRFLVSASHDKSIRIWEETDEQIFLEEEREKELEELYESTLTTAWDRDPDEEDETAEVAAASKQTVESLMAGERIQEALELGMADLALLREWEETKRTQPNIAPPQRNLVYMALGGISAEDHLMNVLQKIKASALQDALLTLSFSTVPALFTFLNIFAVRSMNIPLTCRILFFMLKVHHKQIVASRTMRTTLDGIRVNLRRSLQRQKDEMGFNAAALKVLGMQVKESSIKTYVDENWGEEDEARNIRKRAFVQVA